MAPVLFVKQTVVKCRQTPFLQGKREQAAALVRGKVVDKAKG
jgi:hypothetical protein